MKTKKYTSLFIGLCLMIILGVGIYQSIQSKPQSSTQDIQKKTENVTLIITGFEEIGKGNIQYEEGLSVLDALKSYCTSQNIELKTKGSYVTSIQGLKEFDHGNMSGWKYKVNGEIPGQGANQYQLNEGDQVEWFYVTKK